MDEKDSICWVPNHPESIPWGQGHPEFELTIDDLFKPEEAYRAKYVDWVTLPYLTIKELTALSFGFDPNAADWENIVSPEHPFSKSYRRRYEQAVRAVENSQLDASALSLRAYVHWAAKVGLEIDDGLINSMGAVSAPRKVKAAPITDTKVRQSIVKMALGMVCEQYGGVDSRCYAEICQDLNGIVSVDAASVAKILKAEMKDYDLLSAEEWNVSLRLIYGLAVIVVAYNPDDKRADAMNDIAVAMKKHGFKMNVGTIRRRMKQAVAFLKTEQSDAA